MMQRKRKIILVSLFVYTGEDDNIRINTIYDLLKVNNDVSIITTDFNHRIKQKHTIINSNRNIELIKVPEYKRNIGLKRFYSHGIFACKLYKYLKGIKQKPDIVYCIVPTISSGYACSVYCKKNKIPFAVDVIDLWPESFVTLTPLPWFFSILTYPWKMLASYVYGIADKLFAESIEYAKIAQKSNRKTTALPVYLGTDNEKYQKLIANSSVQILKPENEIWICYAGGLGNSYDFNVILEAFKSIIKAKYENVKLLFIGGGIKADEILAFIKKNNLPAIITGFLSYADFLKYLSLCDIALNPFLINTKVVHSYKFNDYISAGLAIVNNLKGETSEFIIKHDIGLNFDYEKNLLIDQLLFLIKNNDVLARMKKNSVYVAKNILDKKLIYKELIDQLEK